MSSFLLEHVKLLQADGYVVALASSDPEQLRRLSLGVGAEPVHIPMERMPTMGRDLRALWVAYRSIGRARPRVVNVGTPKAALLVGIAAWLQRVPVRVYTVHGLRFEGSSGLRRRLLMATERLTCAMSTKVIAVSPSVGAALRRENLVQHKKLTAISPGSISGVDVDRFSPRPDVKAAFHNSRRIPADAFVFCFVGRLVMDKGLADLESVWREVAEASPSAFLLIAGDVEGGAASQTAIAVRNRLASLPRVILLGRLDDVETVYAAADALLHPSHREGFGNVILEAASAGIPAVAYRVTGCVDAIVDGVTGLLVEPRNTCAFASAAVWLVENRSETSRLGVGARARAKKEFEPTVIVRRHISEMNLT